MSTNNKDPNENRGYNPSICGYNQSNRPLSGEYQPNQNPPSQESKTSISKPPSTGSIIK